MAFESIVSAVIEAAQLTGEFQSLAGSGRPIDLTDYFNTPPEIRITYSILKNAGIQPLEVELLKEIEAVKEEIAHTTSTDKQILLYKELNDKQLRYNLVIERLKRF